MKYDIILAGVGGQGVLSLAAIIATAAVQEGKEVRQSEVHGMAQRGGAVMSHLRISDKEIHSDLIGEGSAEMILSMEPIESLRYTHYLHKEGVLVTSREPFINITNYPESDLVDSALAKIPHHRVVDTTLLAKDAGSSRTANIVMVGAASNHLPLNQESLEKAIREIFNRKGSNVVEMNLKAFRLGREA